LKQKENNKRNIKL